MREHRDMPIPEAFPPDFSPEHASIIKAVAPYTMTSPERIVALCDAIAYLERNNIFGAVVECGVWRGGSSMAAMLAMTRKNRPFYLCDTFTGMTEPGVRDVTHDGVAAVDEGSVMQCNLETVAENISTVGYPQHLIRYAVGDVTVTMPHGISIADLPIALLRLDTDWYESTRHELEVLYPLLARGGVLIIDDYGHWRGAREATDEFFGKFTTHNAPLLSRIDYTGRIAVKP